MSKREKNLVLVLCLLIVVLAYRTYVSTVTKNIDSLKEQNVSLQMQKDEIDAKLARIPTLEENLTVTQEKLDTLKASLQDYLNDEDVDDLLSTLAEQNALTVTGVSVMQNADLFAEDETEVGEALRAMEKKVVSITFKGTSSDFIAMTDALLQRGDVLILSLNHSENGLESTYTISCVLFMEHADGWMNNETTEIK